MLFPGRNSTMDVVTGCVKSFLHNHYSDQQLAALLAHAEDGKLCYYSCCCFIGFVTANHPYKEGECYSGPQTSHLHLARELPGAYEAEKSFRFLGATDEMRREALIPIIRAEMAEREQARSESSLRMQVAATNTELLMLLTGSTY